MRILVECYPDEALLRALGIPKKQLRHERCKGEVVKRVLKLDETIGLIDEDPRRGPRPRSRRHRGWGSAG